MSNSNGRATAMTVLIPIRPGRTVLSRFAFFLVRNIPLMTDVLRKLSFIHFAWWAIVSKFPDNGPPQQPEQLHYDYLLFESNFNGSAVDYVDAFGLVLPVRMQLVWGPTFGFPGPKPTGGMIRYLGVSEFPVDHYYAAYPEASTKMVLSALRLDERLEAFGREAVDLSAEQFTAAYRRLVSASQWDL